MGEPDPTTEFLRKLADESQWAVRRNIPIFEPHTRGDVTVRAADLQAICDKSNRLLTERGVPGRLTNKHTIRPRADGGGIEPVPDAQVIGFQKNYRVGTYGPKNLPCILVDWYVYPEWADKVDRSPHRSVEYQTLAGIIRGAAVMVNDPYLDLGIVVHASGERTLTYAFGEGTMPAMGPADANTPGDKKDEPKEPMHTPEEEKLFEKCRAYMCSKYGLDESWPAMKKEPTADKQMADGDKDKAKGQAVTPMSSDKDIALYQQQLGQMRAEVEGLRAERDLERCQALLATGLVGYSLSADEQKKEIGKLLRTPAADRPERVKELQAIYAGRKVPTGMLDLYHGHVEPQADAANSPFAEPWYHKAAMTYMLDHPGMQYAAACEHVQAQAAKK